MSARRPKSPPIPQKPSHLKSLNSLSLDSGTSSKSVTAAPPPTSASSNPFDDKNESLPVEESRPHYDSSSSSVEYKGGEYWNEHQMMENLKTRVQSTPMFSNGLSSSALVIPPKSALDIPPKSALGEYLNNPFADPVALSPANEKPNLPPRPLLPPRPSVASSSSASRRESSNSSPNLLLGNDVGRLSLGTLNQTVDVKKNEQSSIFKKPPPLQSSRLSTNGRKINGNDSYASGVITGSGLSLQASGLLRLKEDLHVPNSDKCSRALPVPEHLAVHEILNKSHTRGLAISGFYTITAGHSIKVWYSPTGENKATIPNLGAGNDSKVHSVSFVTYPPSDKADFFDQYAWIGAERGEIIEFDISTGEITAKSSSHTSTVTHIIRGAKEMYTIDEHGSLRIWLPDPRGKISLAQRPHALRIQARPACAIIANGLMWTSQSKFIEIYCLEENAASILEKRIDSGQGWSIASPISALAYNPTTGQVYASHDSGKISVYACDQGYERVMVIQATSYKITAMLVVANRIWIGLQTGKILIFEPCDAGWICILDFLAYQNAGVGGLSVDDRALLNGSFNVVVTSVSDGGYIRLWDGLLRSYLTDCHVRTLASQYSRILPINISIMTFNIDSRKPSDLDTDALESFVAARRDVDVFVFGFQELVDLENKGMTAKTFLVGSNKAAKALDSTLDERLILWQDRLTRLFPATYTVIHVSQLVGLFQFIISKNSFAIKDVSTSHVKTGMGGLYGNKGAIATRFLVENSSFCFVNTHLAAHQSHISERNKDISQILKDGSFPKLDLEHHFQNGGDGTMILDHEYVFWSGDLNYRIDDSRQSVLDAIEKADWPFLWQNDQLLKQMVENKSFGLRTFIEQQLAFPPTFKYNRGTDQYDTSEKMRIPAYCDRILYRGDRIKQHLYQRLDIKMSDHRPVIADFTAEIMKIDFGLFGQALATSQAEVTRTFDDSVHQAKEQFLSAYFSLQSSQAAELLDSREFTAFFLNSP